MGLIKEIPATALAIKVTNVTNPSCMKIYHEEDYFERLDEITNKMRLRIKHKNEKESSETSQPQIGDVVVMHNELVSDLDLPAWWVRGLLKNVKVETMEYDIFLVDHGYIIRTHKKDFTVIPKCLISDEYLTFSVGIYNLIPAKLKPEESGTSVNMEIAEKWSDLALRITREALSASSKTYFDYLAIDDDGKKYGELYLTLDEEIMSLGDILVCHGQAIYLSKDLFSMINEKSQDTKYTINSVNDGVILDIDKCVLNSPRNHEISINNEKNENDKNVGANLFSDYKSSKKKLRYFGENYQRILVSSKIRCECLFNIEDARFPARIHRALRNLDIIALRRIQSHMWPAISKGLNVLAIGAPKSGKTIGYVLPIVSSIASWKTVPKGNNPAILILCSSTSDVINTSSLCNELLEAYTDIRCVAGWNGQPDRSLAAEIYNGCQILVATPPFLIRFINQDSEHRKLINFGNLSYLIIDGIDIVLNKYFEPFKQLLTKHVQIGLKQRQITDKEPAQIVAVARHWTSLVKSFAKEFMIDPYICIGSYMEAAIFGRIKPQLIIFPSNKKIEKVTDLLGDHILSVKTMIICGNSTEAHALNDYISKSKKTLMACEKMSFTDIHVIRECWKSISSGIYPVLICTDEVLDGLNITDIDWLIHFSVTLPSKTQFYFRFSTLMDNLKMSNGKCKVTIIMDETNDVQLYGVVSVIKSCGTKLSPTFMDKVMKIVASLDRNKKMYPICDDVKAFGFCSKKNSCPYRHCVLAGVDAPVTSIKIGDKVKLNVTYVHNATHFTARIMEYINPDKTVTRYSAGEYVKISSMIQTYYSDKRNRRCHKKVQVGDICVLEESLDNFQRVKVLNIEVKGYEGLPIAAELKCIDSGAILQKISVTRLMEIPKELANYVTHIVEVFLAGLVPYDDECEWNSRAIDAALNWFPDKTNENSFVLGTVRLHLADTLWVDPLEIHASVIGYPNLVVSSLKPYMLKLKHGEISKDHLTKLYELCRIGGVKNFEEEKIDEL